MECRPLEITVLSATDLKDVNFLSTMDVYAVVKISGDHHSKSKQKTHVDKDCGPNPKWNFPLKFTVADDAAKQDKLTLKFKIFSERTLGDREIGVVKVPIKELLDNFSDNEKHEKHVSYCVKTPSRKIKGTLDFSYKFGEKFTAPVPKPNPEPSYGVHKKLGDPVMAYPPGHEGTSQAYPPPAGYPAHGGYPPAHAGYTPAPGGYPPAPVGYPPAGGCGYPPAAPQQGYGYPHHGGAPGYGYPQYPPQGGYGAPQKPKKNNGNMALGLGAGLLGGLLIGDMVDDATDWAFSWGFSRYLVTQAMNYSLDINVRCLQGLKIKNMLFNKRVYAVVSVVGSYRSIQKTPYGKFEAEAHKAETWKWDYPMRFHVQESMVQENRLMVVIRLRRNTGCFCRDKDIGEVYIPIKQLFDTINGLDNSGTYQVHSPSGKLKGYLTLWYKFHEYCSSRSASDENLFNNLRSSVLASSSSSSSARSSEEVAHQYRVLPSAPPL